MSTPVNHVLLRHKWSANATFFSLYKQKCYFHNLENRHDGSGLARSTWNAEFRAGSLPELEGEICQQLPEKGLLWMNSMPVFAAAAPADIYTSTQIITTTIPLFISKS